MTAIAPIAFVGGMFFGSFAGVVAHRVPRGESIVGRPLALRPLRRARSPPTTTSR